MRQSSKLMNRVEVIIFTCDICGECSEGFPLGGLTDIASMTFPINACPHCGPIHWEVMQICRETTVGSFLN